MIPCGCDNDLGVVLYEWERVKKKIPEWESELTAFRAWFDDLDVSAEVTEYIRELDRTGRLEEILGNALNEKVKVIIPGGGKIGCPVIFADVGGLGVSRAVVVDLGADEGVSVCNVLARMGIRNVTLCITHLHNDHVTLDGVKRLVALCNVETVIYSRPDWSLWSGRDYKSVIDGIVAYLDSVSVPHWRVEYERENISTGIHNLGCHALNCSADSFSRYYGDNYDENMLHTDYNTELNNFSTVYEFYYGEHRFVCTGDIMPNAEGNAEILNAVSGADFYTVPHHGLNITANAEFIKACSGVGIVGVYGSGSEDRLSAGYPDTYGKRIFTNAARDVVVNLGLYSTSIEGDTLATADTFAGYFIPAGTDVRELPPGVYYSTTNEHTQTLRGLPSRLTSGFRLTVTRGARSENALEVVSLYGWHSTVYRYNKSVGVWTYTEGVRLDR